MPLQLSNPSFLKALNQSCHVGSLALQQHPWWQSLSQELHDEQLEQALHDEQLEQALHDEQLEQALLDEQLEQALLDAKLKRSAAPTEAVIATKKKMASKLKICFFILILLFSFKLIQLFFNGISIGRVLHRNKYLESA